MTRVLFGEVAVDYLALEPAVARVVSAARRSSPLGVHLVNVASLDAALSDAAVAACFAPPALNLADGGALRLVSRLSGAPLPTLRGPDLFRSVLTAGQPAQIRHFFIGGSPRLLERLQATALELAPAAVVAGTFSPPFDEHAMDLAVATAIAAQQDYDIAWIGMGTPKQDLIVERVVREAEVTAVAIGAAFDFVARSKPEAPQWLQNTGFEWTHRLRSEPRRLAGRYAAAALAAPRLSRAARRVDSAPQPPSGGDSA